MSHIRRNFLGFICSIVALALFVGCRDENSEVESVLVSAGNNRESLEYVITHYSKNAGDSLKLRAAYFLIRNMPGHYAYCDTLLHKYDKIFDVIVAQERVNRYTGKYTFPETNAIWDSISTRYGDIFGKKLRVENDECIITSGLLIENIDYAFMAWKLPWASHLKFSEFCEYILPYRFQDEYVESWRPVFWKKYSWLRDSMGLNRDPVRACEIINNDIKKWFRFNTLFNRYPGAISPRNLLKAKMGRCLDQAAIANFAMRTMGIPVVHEYIPQWGDRSMGHDFSAVLGKDGKFIDFLGGELAPGCNEIRNKAPKIYRSTFSWRHNEFLLEGNNILDVPSALNSFFLQDVSGKYIPTSSFKVDISSTRQFESVFLYLSVFNDQAWIPVAGSRIRSGSAVFKNVGRNIVYLPSYFIDGKVVPAADALLVREDGSVVFFKPNSLPKISVTLSRKYPLVGYKRNWLLWMGKGRFQASNSADFSGAVNLFVVPDTIEMVMHKSKVKSPKLYRYVRYLFPYNSSGSLGEIAFYRDTLGSIGLVGRKIKSTNVDSVDLEYAFDGRVETYIDKTPNDLYNGLWIGLDLGRRQRIFSVGYSPRNDKNGIIKGMRYELFYWDFSWKSLGSKFGGEEDRLVYDNVPSDALLLLRNHTEGKEERIFIFRSKNQIWY